MRKQQKSSCQKEKQGSQSTSFWQRLGKFISFQEPEEYQHFVLRGTDESAPPPNFNWQAYDTGDKGSDQNDSQDKEKRSQKGQKRTGHGKRRPLKKPQQIRGGVLQKESTKEQGQEPVDLKKLRVSELLDRNKQYIEEIYSLPKNKDIIIREFVISLPEPVRAFAVFVEGISDRETINLGILKPLMILSSLEETVEVHDLAEYIKDRIIFGNQIDIVQSYDKIIESVNYGSTAVFIDGSPKCITVETKGWDKRPIGLPESEKVIRGPHEAFNETLRSNTGLIRKAIRNTNLITEMLKVGERNKTDVAIMYLKDVASPSLVAEVKRRIASVKSDYIGDTGVLEQFIEDHPFMLAPQALATERPDRVVSFIIDGKVAILIDGSPIALVVPTTFFSLLHTPEDYYLRTPYGNITRFLRIVAVIISIITPGVYISITNYHQEMIPTELILSIAAAREAVPFPTLIEVIIMEFFFELIREAGVRVPGVIGNTLGIVGALILGQAAVEAGIVSPILIIVVAVTGLASFAIPNYSISFAFRGIRFLFTALAAVFGFIGISAGLFLALTALAGIKSFGVPLLSPVGPRTRSNPDVMLRGPVWSLEERPDYAETLDRRKQPQVSRGWLKKKSYGKGVKDEGNNENRGQ
ncbi:MAG: spore germination protein [Peptococcia bacterium]